MNKVIILLLALVWCHAASSQKVTFRLNAAANYGLIPDQAETQQFNMSMGTVPNFQSITFHTRFKEKAGATVGGSLSVNINPAFSLEAGLQVSLVRFQMTKETIFPGADPSISWRDNDGLRRWRDDESGDGLARDNDGNILYDANGEPIRTHFNFNYGKDNPSAPASPSYISPEPHPKTGNTAIVYINIPVSIRYNLHKLVDLKAGLSTSQLAYSERYIVVANSYFQFMDPAHESSITWTSSDDNFRYGKDKSASGLNKTLLSLTTGITLKATKYLGLDLDYARYLTPIYTSQADKHKYNLFSTGLSYAFLETNDRLMAVIRTALLEDLRSVHLLEQELFGQHSYPLFVLRQLFDITPGLFVVAEAAGSIIGYGIGHYSPEKAEGWLLSLGVQPACRGQRIGEQLTTALTAAIAAKGARTISLTVHPDNTPALKIYERAGFTSSGFHADYYLDHSPRWLLVKMF